MAQLSEAAIRELASPTIFQRGSAYFREGRVGALVRRGNELHAEVEGSELYSVYIDLAGGGVGAIDCSCPYWEDVCKHAVAVLLAYLKQPDRVDERPPLAALLAGLDRAQLEKILLALAAEQPDLIELIEDEVALLTPPAAAGSAPAAPNLAGLRRKVAAALRDLDAEGYYDSYVEYDLDLSALERLAEQARPLIAAGDARGALLVLEAFTAACVKDLAIFDGLYDMNDQILAIADPLWAEAFLSADLTAAERRQWRQKLRAWHDEANVYGEDGTFDLALSALEEGWDAPGMRQVLAGEAAELDSDPELASIRLEILERQGRHEEYLRLAAAEGLVELHAAMLARLGRLDEALAYAAQTITSPIQALILAQQLWKQDQRAAALQVAERGLDLAPDPLADGWHGRSVQANLARWLRDQALEAGDALRVLRGAAAALQAAPTLADYTILADLAGGQWPAARESFLAALRESDGVPAHDRIAIFLHEGLVEDAIAVLNEEDGDYVGDGLFEQVAAAAVQAAPEWAIAACKARAEAIIEATRSSHYDLAVHWLGYARAAYGVVQRQPEWGLYLASLIEHHRRKSKLVPMLERLRRQDQAS